MSKIGHIPKVIGARSSSELLDWIAQRRRWLLFALLFLFYLTLLEGVADPVSRTLAVVQVGLFFLWQPFIQADRHIAPLSVAVLAALVVYGTAHLSWGTLILWALLIAGIIGGKVFHPGSRWNRLFHLLALAFLVAAMLAVLVPRVLPGGVQVGGSLDQVVIAGLPILMLIMGLLPVEPEAPGYRNAVDLAYSAFIFLILAVLMLGSVAGMAIGRLDYLSSLVVATLVTAGGLILLTWAWNPRGGFAGFGTILSRHLLSMGTPFEEWVESLSAVVQGDDDPGLFVARACAELPRRIPWVSGGEWRTEDGVGSFGTGTDQRSEYRHERLTVVVFTRHASTPVMAWHLNVVTRLIAEFYNARVRAAELRRLTYLQAIYETGSRLTHDVKNLLQSLNTLCAAATGDDASSPRFQEMVRRQLPVIAARLQQTLEKLKTPELAESPAMDADDWWHDLAGRFAGESVEFAPWEGVPGLRVPAALFNAAAENLLRNALEKRQREPGIAIRVCLETDAEKAALSVTDCGSAIGDDLAREIGRGPVESAGGFGIGLYQIARYAAAGGYRLYLAENRPGRVRFRLAPDSRA